MARIPIIKDLKSTRVASTYGGWLYCDHCGENIGYLCYVTYDNFKFTYQCKCGETGCMHISFGDVSVLNHSENTLAPIKNRLCCPNDESPLLTILENKLMHYQYEIDCVKCNSKYLGAKTL